MPITRMKNAERRINRLKKERSRRAARRIRFAVSNDRDSWLPRTETDSTGSLRSVSPRREAAVFRLLVVPQCQAARLALFHRPFEQCRASINPVGKLAV